MVDAVGAIHSKGIVHHDLKLESFKISDSGRVVLTDLGLTKMKSTEDG